MSASHKPKKSRLHVYLTTLLVSLALQFSPQARAGNQGNGEGNRFASYVAASLGLGFAMIGVLTLAVPYRKSLVERARYVESVCQTSQPFVSTYTCSALVENSCGSCSGNLTACTTAMAAHQAGDCCVPSEKCCATERYVCREYDCAPYECNCYTYECGTTGQPRTCRFCDICYLRCEDYCDRCIHEVANYTAHVNVGSCFALDANRTFVAAHDPAQLTVNCPLHHDCQNLADAEACRQNWIETTIKPSPYPCYYIPETPLTANCNGLVEEKPGVDRSALGIGIFFMSATAVAWVVAGVQYCISRNRASGHGSSGETELTVM